MAKAGDLWDVIPTLGGVMGREGEKIMQCRRIKAPTPLLPQPLWLMSANPNLVGHERGRKLRGMPLGRPGALGRSEGGEAMQF